MVIARFSEPKPCGTEHSKDVRVIHEAVRQFVSPTRTDTVRSAAPKLVPEIVSCTPPVVGPFKGAEKVATGESNVNWRAAVATRPDCHTVTPCNPDPTGTEHVTDVLVDHAVVAQAVLASMAVKLESLRPKFMPTSVMELLAVGGRLAGIRFVGAGASNVNRRRDVPVTPATVTIRSGDIEVDGLREALNTQPRVVAVDHEVVAQPVSPTKALGEKSAMAKLRPEKVTDAPPDRAMLGAALAVATGLSKLKVAEEDPYVLPTLTRTTSPAPALAVVAQARLV